MSVLSVANSSLPTTPLCHCMYKWREYYTSFECAHHTFLEWQSKHVTWFTLKTGVRPVAASSHQFTVWSSHQIINSAYIKRHAFSMWCLFICVWAVEQWDSPPCKLNVYARDWLLRAAKGAWGVRPWASEGDLLLSAPHITTPYHTTMLCSFLVSKEMH